jgi:hypothetical protein
MFHFKHQGLSLLPKVLTIGPTNVIDWISGNHPYFEMSGGIM